jgi:hypothetical protein
MPKQDSQSELDDIFNEHVENIQEGVVSAIQVGENVDYHTFDAKVELREAIEAYVTTRVKEAERLARIDELSALDKSEIANQSMKKMQIRIKGRLEALTTTTNGKEAK